MGKSIHEVPEPPIETLRLRCWEVRGKEPLSDNSVRELYYSGLALYL